MILFHRGKPIARQSGAMDASAILDYYAPLYDWLKKQNEGKKCGW